MIAKIKSFIFDTENIYTAMAFNETFISRKMMIISAIDPGKNGCAVTIECDKFIASYSKLSFSKDNLLDLLKLNDFLEKSKPDLILLEKVSGRNGWGSTQSFNFGSIWGQIRSAVSAYPHKLVTPAQWQKQIHEGIDTNLDAKSRSLCAYRNLFPYDPLGQLKKKTLNKDLLDAFLIAYYGMVKYGKIATSKMEIHEHA